MVILPDHWHALPMIEAVKAGAHVYVQKPISVDVVDTTAAGDTFVGYFACALAEGQPLADALAFANIAAALSVTQFGAMPSRF